MTVWRYQSAEYRTEDDVLKPIRVHVIHRLSALVFGVLTELATWSGILVQTRPLHVVHTLLGRPSLCASTY
eukprot:2103472-Rhodomonas_salina.1